jgi:Helicase associated domain
MTDPLPPPSSRKRDASQLEEEAAAAEAPLLPAEGSPRRNDHPRDHHHPHHHHRHAQQHPEHPEQPNFGGDGDASAGVGGTAGGPSLFVVAAEVGGDRHPSGAATAGAPAAPPPFGETAAVDPNSNGAPQESLIDETNAAVNSVDGGGQVHVPPQDFSAAVQGQLPPDHAPAVGGGSVQPAAAGAALAPGAGTGHDPAVDSSNNNNNNNSAGGDGIVGVVAAAAAAAHPPPATATAGTASPLPEILAAVAAAAAAEVEAAAAGGHDPQHVPHLFGSEGGGGVPAAAPVAASVGAAAAQQQHPSSGDHPPDEDGADKNKHSSKKRRTTLNDADAGGQPGGAKVGGGRSSTSLPSRQACISDPFKRSFNDMLYELLKFRVNKGHLRVPPTHGNLGVWVYRLRVQHQALQRDPSRRDVVDLTRERMDVLNSLEFCWDLHKYETEKNWNDRYAELVQWKETHGHCNVPQSDPNLGKWVKMQRDYYNNTAEGRTQRKGSLTQDKIEKLEAIGFEWRLLKMVGWDKRFEELCEWKRLHGHCNVPTQTSGSLGRWVSKQRIQMTYRKNGEYSQLSDDRIEKLNSIGTEPLHSGGASWFSIGVSTHTFHFSIIQGLFGIPSSRATSRTTWSHHHSTTCTTTPWRYRRSDI